VVVVTLGAGPHQGAYRDWQSEEIQHFDDSTEMELGPWQARVFVASFD
jgi:hypothetical protein